MSSKTRDRNGVFQISSGAENGAVDFGARTVAVAVVEANIDGLVDELAEDVEQLKSPFVAPTLVLVLTFTLM